MRKYYLIGENIEDVDKIYSFSEDMIKHAENAQLRVVLIMGYIIMSVIYMRKEEYQKVIDTILKGDEVSDCLEKINADSDNIEINSESVGVGLEKVLVALSKRAMGNESLSELKKLEKNIGKVEKESSEFWHDYYKYELFGPVKGKIFLKFAYNKVQELKSNLKGESLKDFLDGYYVKLVLNEWEKIKGIQ